MDDAYKRLIDGSDLTDLELQKFEEIATSSPELAASIEAWKNQRRLALSSTLAPRHSQLILRTGNELMPRGASNALNERLEPDDGNVYVVKIAPPRKGDIVNGTQVEAGQRTENIMTIEGKGVSGLRASLDPSGQNDYMRTLSKVFREVQNQGIREDEPFAVVYESIAAENGQTFDGMVLQYPSATSRHQCVLAAFWLSNREKAAMIKTAMQKMKSNPDQMLTYFSQQLSIATQTDITRISPHQTGELPEEMAVFSVNGGRWDSPEDLEVSRLLNEGKGRTDLRKQ